MGLLGAGFPARALDLFTLWRQPEIPLDLTPGSWVIYRSQTLASGRQDVGLTRIACLPAPGGADDGDRVFEIMPVEERDDGTLEPEPGQGVWLWLDGSLADRQGDLLDNVREAWQWDDGRAVPLDPRSLKDDPLAGQILRSAFTPDTVERHDPTTRIIAGRQFLCEQLVMAARDTQTAELPAGRMIQVSSHEVTAAFSPELPLLGLAFVSERIMSESSLDGGRSRFRAPPPRVRVEVMELVAFGADAESLLGAGD